MKIENAVVLVTGANRGIGLAFARELLARGARKVYAAARNPATVTLPGVHALQLDVTKPDEIAAAARQAADVTLVINNAGIAQPGGFLAEDSEVVARRIFETNFYGVLNVSQAFAPVLKSNGGGALLNVLSIASWVNGGELAAYSASKSAAWSLTNALRTELVAQKTQVLGLHMGYVDTDLTRGFEVPKASPEEIVKHALDGLEAGADEVLADEITRQVKAGLTAARPSYLPQAARTRNWKGSPAPGTGGFSAPRSALLARLRKSAHGPRERLRHLQRREFTTATQHFAPDVLCTRGLQGGQV